jgi:hypothetical protein
VAERFALEVFLRRMPSQKEIDYIRVRVPLLMRSAGTNVEELPNGLGTLFLNETAPGVITLSDHGEESRPMLARASGHVEGGKIQRHIIVRVALTDERAHAVLRKEAAQLDKSAPGLIMIDTESVLGGFASWESLLRGCLEPARYTRVSGICLFRSGPVTTSVGVGREPETWVVTNPHAPLSLPEWITSNIGRFPPTQHLTT